MNKEQHIIQIVRKTSEKIVKETIEKYGDNTTGTEAERALKRERAKLLIQQRLMKQLADMKEQ